MTNFVRSPTPSTRLRLLRIFIFVGAGMLANVITTTNVFPLVLHPNHELVNRNNRKLVKHGTTLRNSSKCFEVQNSGSEYFLNMPKILRDLMLKTENATRNSSFQRVPSTNHREISYDRLRNFNDSDKVKDFSQRSVPKSNVTKLIIYGRFRTGSTFTSQVFNHQNQSFVLFEPLNFYSAFDQHSATLRNMLLGDILNCNFSDDAMWKLYDNHGRQRMFCKLHPSCNRTLAFGGAQNLCDKATLRVVKVIRVPTLSDLDHFIHQGVKIIHLVRDPRGVWNSRMKCHHQYVLYDIRLYCDAIRNDLDYAQALNDASVDISKVYHLVRYEELAYHVADGVRRLFRFLGITLSVDTVRWAELQGSLSATSPENHNEVTWAYGTKRSNPAFTARAWRWQLSWSRVQEVQQLCSDVLGRLGYQRFENYKEQLVTSTDVLQPMKMSPLKQTLIKLPEEDADE